MEPTDQTLHNAIIEFLPDATFVIDRAGRVIAWNRSMELMTGVPKEEMLGKGDYEYALPFYHVRKPMLANLVFMPEVEISRRYDTVERIGDTLIVDIFIPDFRPGGAFFWAKAGPLYDSQGGITGAIETIRDITARKRAEEDLVQSRRCLSDIINFLPDATFAINRDGAILTWNREMEELTGIPAADMLGKGDLEYSLPFYGYRRPMLANLVLMPEAEVDSQYTHVHREGNALLVDTFIPNLRGGAGKWFWGKASPLYGLQGEIRGAIQTIRDITARKQEEQELVQSRRRLAEIIEFLPDATLAINLEGVVVTWNREMERLTGIPASSMIGKGDLEYALPFYGYRRPMLANLVLMPEAEVDSQYTHVEREGDTLLVDTFIPNQRGGGGRHFWAKASPLYNVEGEMTGAIQTIRDTTKRRETEERLARSNADLQIAAEIQRSFLPEVIPQLAGFDIAGRSLMAKEVGGDFFDVVPLEVVRVGQDRLGIFIADVAGKGIPAALFMALSRIVVRVNATWHQQEPAEAIRDANAIITPDSKGGMFVTLFYGVLDAQDRSFTYVNAGHNPPLICHGADGSFSELPATGIAIGAVEDAAYDAGMTVLTPGDVLVLYTDGITEAENEVQDMFGEDRLREAIVGARVLPAAEIVAAILGAVQAFAGTAAQSDDITLMVVRAV
ncbi:MAG: SpoIIE family protein phosphatase [Methanospirillum sp.]